MNQVLWRNFQLDIYDFDAWWKDVGGVYIFSGFDYQNGWWVPLYVGETSSFRSRIPNHERRAEAMNLGATHVLAMVAPRGMRMVIERELIAQYQPPLNVQHRSSWAELAQAAALNRRFSPQNQGWSLADLFQPPHNPVRSW